MPGYPSEANLIARQALEQTPDIPTRTLARVLFENNPKMFKSIDNARKLIQYLRGQLSSRAKAFALNTSPHLIKEPLWQINKMPLSISKPTKALQINGNNRVLIMSDMHIPYHDSIAIEAAVKFGRDFKPNIVYLNGDIADFYGISRHDKDPRREMKQELDSVRQFLYWLRKCFPKAQIIYKIGNHEDRLERFLVKNAPVFLGVPDFEVSELLKFRDMGIELVKSLQLTRFGKLPVYHGHELPQGMSSPVNPARGLWMRVQETCVAGHWHRVSEHTEKTGISDKISSCWSLGCLCDMKPDYASVNRWSAGFATVETDKNGEFEFHNKKIINRKVY